MRIVVIGEESPLKEWTLPTGNANVDWIEDVDEQLLHEADAIIDLLFENIPQRLEMLKLHGEKSIIVNSNLFTLEELDKRFVRINGWNTFLHGPFVEASAVDEFKKQKAEAIFESLGKSLEWVPDIVGFIAPRVISNIINEAYFALDEGVSTKEQINTALKLGTAYPYGPFEWAEKIGLKNIALLLQKLSIEDECYLPCRLLVQDAGI